VTLGLGVYPAQVQDAVRLAVRRSAEETPRVPPTVTAAAP
jgi:hypothetical protein